MSEPAEVILVCCFVGGRAEVAEELRALAGRVDGGELLEREWPRIHLRAYHDANLNSGEENMSPGRYYGVVVSDGDGDPIALFRDKIAADGMIAMLGGGCLDLEALRMDVVGTVWNSVDPDPRAEKP